MTACDNDASCGHTSGNLLLIVPLVKHLPEVGKYKKSSPGLGN